MTQAKITPPNRIATLRCETKRGGSDAANQDGK